METNNYQELAFKLNSLKQTIIDAKRDGFSTVYVHEPSRKTNYKRCVYLVNPLTNQSMRLDTL